MQKKLSNIIRKAVFFMIPIASTICYAGISDDVYASSETTEDSLIYNFRDAKKEGTITFVKRWKDGKKEEDRNIPNIEISTKKPRKNVSGYTVIFHGNGMTFADGSTKNEMLFNSSMNIIGGQYKVPGEAYAFWYTEPECINKVNVSSTGIPDLQLDGDINLYARAVTFVTKTGTEFNNAIPDNMSSVIFTDEEMPDGAEMINIDEDNDGGVVAWTEGNIMKVSTQIEGIPIQFNSDCEVMFGNKSNLNSIEFDNIDTSKVEEMGNMFKSCSSIANLDLSSFNTSNTENMSSMFKGCGNLTTLNISSFNTAKVVYMNSMFWDCRNLEEIDVSKFNTQNVVNMNDMFNSCTKLKNLDLRSFKTSKVRGMGYMFYGCSNLQVADVSGFSTGNVTTFIGMFSGCKSLAIIDVSNFDTSNASTFGEMFYQCKSVTELDVSKFNTSKSTSFNHMFCGCSKVATIDVSKFNTANAKMMQYMFSSCSSLVSVDLSSFSTENVINMEQIFYGCSLLKSIDMSSFKTPNVTNVCNMFNMCYALTSLDLSNFDTSKVTNMNWTFSNLRSLKTLTLGENFAFYGTVYGLTGTWVNSAREEFDAKEIPGNVVDTYTKI